MSKFLKGIKGNEKKDVTSFDADAIAEKLHSVTASSAATAPVIETLAPTTKAKAVRAVLIEEEKEELHT